MVLYQATLPLLSKSADPKFIVLGSRAGVLGIVKQGSAGYGQSKAGVHFLVSCHVYHLAKMSAAV
jgi:NADP-dependent 3-hydroxy acid dehydrogenase YdfG